MKKISSIVLLAAFVLLQANRYTVYMSCRLQSMYTATVCDCEQVLSGPEHLPAGDESNARFHYLQPDDFYCSAVETGIHVFDACTEFPPDVPGKDAQGYPLNLLKPPAAGFFA